MYVFVVVRVRAGIQQCHLVWSGKQVNCFQDTDGVRFLRSVWRLLFFLSVDNHNDTYILVLIISSRAW